MFARLDRYPELLLHEVPKRCISRFDDLVPVRVHLCVARLRPRVRKEEHLK